MCICMFASQIKDALLLSNLQSAMYNDKNNTTRLKLNVFMHFLYWTSIYSNTEINKNKM